MFMTTYEIAHHGLDLTLLSLCCEAWYGPFGSKLQLGGDLGILGTQVGDLLLQLLILVCQRTFTLHPLLFVCPKHLLQLNTQTHTHTKVN